MDSYTSHEWHCATKLYGPPESFTGIGLCSPLFHTSWFRAVWVATSSLATSVFTAPDHLFLLLSPVCLLVLLLSAVPQYFPRSCEWLLSVLSTGCWQAKLAALPMLFPQNKTILPKFRVISIVLQFLLAVCSCVCGNQAFTISSLGKKAILEIFKSYLSLYSLVS